MSAVAELIKAMRDAAARARCRSKYNGCTCIACSLNAALEKYDAVEKSKDPVSDAFTRGYAVCARVVIEHDPSPSRLLGEAGLSLQKLREAGVEASDFNRIASAMRLPDRLPEDP